MAFSLDRTRSCIKIDEPNLISVYRSTSPIVPAVDCSQGHLCDAFICAVREYNLFRVYIGLYDFQLKSNLIFIAEPVGFDNKKTALLIKEAETFLTNIGFSIERVNIEFSPATREVILRDMKIMREPSLAVRLDSALLAIEDITAERNELIQKAIRAQKAFKAEVEKLRRQLAEINSAALEVKDKPVSNETSVSILMSELDTLKADATAAQDEIRSARLEIQSLKAAAKSFQDQVELEKVNNQAVYSNEALLLKEDINRIKIEYDMCLEVQSKEINALRAALAIADDNLSLERAKNESALQEMDALERNAAIELKKLKKRVDSLSDEKNMLESMAAKMKIKARGEIDRLQQINQSQRSAAINKINSLKDEMRQLSEARAVIASPVVALPLIGEARIASDSKNEHGAFIQITDSEISGEALFNPFGFFDNAVQVCFKPYSTLEGIPYAVPEDVVEVHRSYNKIQAAPFGKKVQNCEGFVCVAKNLDHGTLVYVVWFIKETEEVLVCLPDYVLEGSDIVLNMVREGVAYFERVGFIMDELILMNDPEQRQNQLDSLPFFHKIVMECAA